MFISDAFKFVLNIDLKNKEIKNRQNQIGVKRISMSLTQNLFKEFEKAMVKAGFSDRSKAIQAAALCIC